MPDGLRIVDREQDPYAWALAQVALIGRGAAGVKRLDLEGLKGFLEEAAGEMLSKVTSQLVNLMAHAAKVAHSRNSDIVGHWRSECVEFHDQIVDTWRSSMRPKIDMDVLWRRAKRKVSANFADHGEPVPSLAASCPFTVEDLVDPELDMERLVDRLRPSP